MRKERQKIWENNPNENRIVVVEDGTKYFLVKTDTKRKKITFKQ